MPVNVKLTAEGAWAWIAQNPAAARADKVKAAMRRAQKEAFAAWAKLSGGGIGLALRFEPEAFGTLGLTPRSRKYQTRQIKTLGERYPYTAPLSCGQQLSPSGEMKRLVLGGGYNITSQNSGGETVTTTFSVTGARILNRLADPWRSTYSREFLGLDRGGRRDAAWIIAKANELARQYITKEMISAQRVALRDQAAAQNESSAGAA